MKFHLLQAWKINFENRVVMGNFDTEIRNDFTVNADKAVMEELIKLIS